MGQPAVPCPPAMRGAEEQGGAEQRRSEPPCLQLSPSTLSLPGEVEPAGVRATGGRGGGVGRGVASAAGMGQGGPPFDPSCRQAERRRGTVPVGHPRTRYQLRLIHMLQRGGRRRWCNPPPTRPLCATRPRRASLSSPPPLPGTLWWRSPWRTPAPSVPPPQSGLGSLRTDWPPPPALLPPARRRTSAGGRQRQTRRRGWGRPPQQRHAGITRPRATPPRAPSCALPSAARKLTPLAMQHGVSLMPDHRQVCILSVSLATTPKVELEWAVGRKLHVHVLLQ